MAEIAMDTHVNTDASHVLDTLRAALQPTVVLMALAASLYVVDFVSEDRALETPAVEVAQGEPFAREWAWQLHTHDFAGMYRTAR